MAAISITPGCLVMEDDLTVSFDEFALRAVVAMVLGLIVGLDREFKRKPMGARVYMLVSLGACAYMMIALNFTFGSLPEASDSVSLDPTKIIDGVVTGIGFLGAGAIMSSTRDGKLKGIGTGAGVWAVGSVGIACGLGYFWEAGFVAATILVVLSVFEWIEHKTEENAEELKDKVEEESGS